MKTGNYKEVYITRDSDSTRIGIWNPNIGIVKFEGCVEFHSARSLGKHSRLGDKIFIGRLDSIYYDRSDWDGNPDYRREDLETAKLLGFIPRKGTAWLYNTTTGKRTRVDKDMALIDPDTGKVIG
jgi:hypothetical protein